MKITQRSNKRTIIILASLLVIGLASAGFFASQSTRTPGTTNGPIPDYATVLPRGTSIDRLGGWEQLLSPEGEPRFVYADSIDDVSISVSEQPLPESFRSNTDSQVAELAASYSATKEIDARDTKVYIGSSSKGPQSIIFTKKGLLVLIKSQASINDAAWIQYISNLE